MSARMLGRQAKAAKGPPQAQRFMPNAISRRQRPGALTCLMRLPAGAMSIFRGNVAAIAIIDTRPMAATNQ